METKVKSNLPRKVKYISMFDRIDNEQSYVTKLKFSNFKLNWTIENFEFICKSVKLIESPKFPADNVTNAQWYIQLEPTELKNESGEKFRISLKNTDGNERFVNVKIIFFNSFKKVEVFVSSSLRSDRNLFWVINGSEFYHSFGDVIPKNVLVTCELSVFDSGTSIVEKPLIDFPKSNDLVDNIENLYDDKNFKDVVFTVGKKKYTAHKNILSSRSPVFAQMFKGKKKEDLTSLVKISDIRPAVFENLLRFIYTDKVQNLSKIAFDLYVAAQKYQLEKLKTICINNLNSNLSTETVLKVLKLADMKSILKLKNICLERLNSDLKAVKETTEFAEFVEKYPHLFEELEKFSESIDMEVVDEDDNEHDDSQQKLDLTFRA
ncbi:speckle-type POZ protein-like [Leptopilina heterotoma]|uniref:speckle-type POZ protein-like n=1 Tax=Leptopilina heterotoma TaxID=63436 RepID=UPI001CA9B53F|nr:speckle-type POZ protein-like [Leptopilina heterotoma]